MSGARWGKGAIVAYTKFYVNPPRFQPLPHPNSKGLVRPSFYQPLGPVSIRRRSAAQVCADAHTDSVAPGDGRIGRMDDGFRSGYRFSQVFSGLIKT